MKVYLAGSVFYYGDGLRNKEWAENIRDQFPGIELYNPTENTEIDGTDESMDTIDILIACIDGDVIPSSTCAEIGMMREKIRRGDHKYIIGIYTGNHEQQYPYQNLYVIGLIKESGILVNNIDDAIKFMKKVAPEYLQEFTDDMYEQLQLDLGFNN